MVEASVGPSRRHSSRLARVQATRDLVLSCATNLFVRQGYLATTMGDIASDAGVAVQTLYLRFGGKAALLKASFDVAVSGDDQPVAVAERAWVEELRRDPDLERALRLLVSSARRILERAVPLFTRIEEAAADPEVAELLLDLKRQKLEMVGIFADILRAKVDFDKTVSLERATDLLYAMGSEELFRVLCVERGWSKERWEEFIFTSLLQLFG
jgi:AcrR family transcriptional regulator